MRTPADTSEMQPIRSSERRAEDAALDEASGIGRRFDGSLRLAVSAVDRQLSLLSAQATTADGAAAVSALLERWAELLEQLALGPAPDVRTCPACGHLGMSAATVCGFCWTQLSPSMRLTIDDAKKLRPGVERCAPFTS